MGAPCKSWIALTRSFTRRSLLLAEGPDPESCSPKRRRYLEQHNCIARICALIMQMAPALEIYPVLEQPKTSLVFHFGPVESVLRTLHVSRIALNLSAFQGSAVKPLILQGCGKFLYTLRQVFQIRKRALSNTRPLAERGPLQSFSGSTRLFSGNKLWLRESAAYTRSFGVAVALCFLGWSAEDVHCELLRMQL